MKRVYWLDLPGNKYSKHLHPQMLKPGGLQVQQRLRLVGQRLNSVPQTVEVSYDRDYVYNWIYREIFLSLQVKSLPQLLDLVSEIWAEFNMESAG